MAKSLPIAEEIVERARRENADPDAALRAARTAVCALYAAEERATRGNPDRDERLADARWLIAAVGCLIRGCRM